MAYYYLIAYDYCVDESEPTGGYEVILRNKKLSQEVNVRFAIERIILNIRAAIAEDYKVRPGLVKVIPKNIQLLE